ncbi:SRPBCC family protein [Nocardioides humi]|uniref:SRPBCC family protein n=1 Tax=Nocardioides humi TaxID=449461 RepID=UPI001129F26C|nr:SRPBCC family protein [Nocardioides humi]
MAGPVHPSAQIDIDAPLAVVWDVMLDTERYAEWNPFVERAETAQPPAVGNPIVLHVVWASGGRTRSPSASPRWRAPSPTPPPVRRPR